MNHNYDLNEHVRVVTTLSNDMVVSSVKGINLVPTVEGAYWTSGQIMNETVIFDDSQPGILQSEIVGFFDDHLTVVSSIEFTTGSKRLHTVTTTTVHHEPKVR